ncbi:unnamed protein product [Rotaria sp. Silwood1]|nr:unnamed protein product [Rotaria sp. Silwood1]CAF3635847.1 unnamed protein product [Rotaria sp. Silwood1]CAF3695806.1 unnamed protein product [Rotaria sp. Silwood1]CAF4836905.1 unnamed protein product [Rotaria sp. Silwood1]CAF4840761.1 unnamed protein product [Rotaria sp. Silwood1]
MGNHASQRNRGNVQNNGNLNPYGTKHSRDAVFSGSAPYGAAPGKIKFYHIFNNYFKLGYGIPAAYTPEPYSIMDWTEQYIPTMVGGRGRRPVVYVGTSLPAGNSFGSFGLGSPFGGGFPFSGGLPFKGRVPFAGGLPLRGGTPFAGRVPFKPNFPRFR